jgi:hypothetical protein
MTADLTALVRDVKPRLLESVPRVTVTVEFSNRSARTLVVDSFRISWPGSEHVEKDAGVVLHANQSVSKAVQIVTADPPNPATTRVEILETRELSLWETLTR